MTEENQSAANIADNVNRSSCEIEYKPTDEIIRILNGLGKAYNLDKEKIKSRYREILNSKPIQILDVTSEPERERHALRVLASMLAAEKDRSFTIGYLITEQDGVIRNRELIHEEGEYTCFNIRKGEKVVGIISDVQVI